MHLRSDGAVKAGTADVLLHELARSEEHEGRLRDHAAALDAAGYGLQVPILEGGVNLFMEGPAGRERLYRDPHGFHLRVSGAVQTESEVRDARDRDPSVLSPNVLLRPVAESALFPTLSYVAGPGEMAYFGRDDGSRPSRGLGNGRSRPARMRDRTAGRLSDRPRQRGRSAED